MSSYKTKRSSGALTMYRKPTKPIRRTNIEDRHYISNGALLSQIVHWAESLGHPLEKVEVDEDHEGEYGSYTEYSRHYFKISREESEEEYGIRLDCYETDLSAWNVWYAENKEEIEATLLARKEEANATHKKTLEREKKRLEKELKALEKSLSKA